MGKGNRERLRRESDNLTSAEVKAKSTKNQTQKGVPLWAGNLILSLIGLLLVVVIIVTTISSSGIVLKLTKYASSNSYELTGTQMTYIFKTLYNNFAAQYSSYFNYLVDTTKSLKDQNSFYKNEDGSDMTWFDYFAFQTEAEAEQLLVLCEMAKARGLDKLTEDEEKEIENAIKTLESTAFNNGYSFKNFIKIMYGPGVTEKDIVTVMTYQTIASNFYEVIQKELEDKITSDRVDAYFAENEKDFILVDYITFSPSASLLAPSTTASEEDKLAASKDYEEDKKLVDEYMKLLKDAKDADAFKSIVIDFYMASEYDDSFDTVYGEEFEDIDEGKRPSEDDKKKFKEETLKKLKEELLKINPFADVKEETEEDKKDDSEKTEEEDKKSDIEKANEAVYDELLGEFSNLINNIFYKGANYSKDNETSEWLFNKDTKVNDKKTTDAKEESKDTGAKSYSGTVALLVKAQYKDTTKTQNVSHLLVQVAEDATDAAKKEAQEEAKSLYNEFMKGSDKSKEAFDKFAEEHTDDSNVYYENVSKGEMVEEFENWIYAKRNVGDVEIVETDYGFHIMYYAGEGVEHWYKDVKNAIYEEDYKAWMEQAKKDANVVINSKNINKIDT